MKNYLEARGFDEGIQKDWSLEPKKDHVLISYYDPEGKLLYKRENWPNGGDPKYHAKYKTPPGEKVSLYNLQRLNDIQDTILLIEGEYNCISAWIMGHYGLGMPGQGNKLEPHLKYIPDRIKKIILLYDEPSLAKERAKEVLEYFDYEKEVYIATYPEGKDANDYYKEGRTIDFKAIMNTADRYFEDMLKRTNIKVDIPENDFVETYKEYALDISDAPAKYQELMALSVMATVLGRQVYLKHGIGGLYPNLYIVLIGKSTIMRKTACLNMAKHIIAKFNKELLLPYDFTPEGLFNLLSGQPQGLITWSEFGGFLINAVSKTYQAGIKEFLTEAYDCPPELVKKLAGKEYRINDIYLNIITATTLHWLIDRITEADTMGGFLGRFVFMPCTPDDKNGWYPMPRPESITLSNRLVKNLKKISELKGEAKLSGEAYLLFTKWQRRHDDEMAKMDDSKGIMGFYGRLSNYVLKFAMLYEISGNRELTVSENSMMRAIKLVNQLKKALNILMTDHIAFTQDSKDSQKVLNIIKADSKPIPRAKLLQNSNFSAKRLDEVLATLIQSDRVQSINLDTGRKTSRAYRYIG